MDVDITGNVEARVSGDYRLSTRLHSDKFHSARTERNHEPARHCFETRRLSSFSF